MKKVGIITFHSAYNYGSVFQAFATQEAVKKLGYEPEIINYRLLEQSRIYSNIRFGYGYKELIKDMTLLPSYAKRNKKYRKFENFFSDRLVLTEKVETPEEVEKIWNTYSVVISGSDQIWNKHSLELEANSWDFMNPYLLKGYSGKKVSYASSTANMTPDELKKIAPYIKDFSAVAMRENSSAEQISCLIGRPVSAVLDPTFLLTKEEWISAMSLKETSGDDILYYSLGGLKTFRRIKNDLIAMANRNHCRVIVVTPFCHVSKSGVFEPHIEYGPEEFLNCLLNARMVVTDSYHGTILSVNFGKNVYSLCKSGNSEFRKTDILKRIGMEDRIVSDPDDLISKEFEDIDYDKVYSELDKYRTQSKKYLESSLRD